MKPFLALILVLVSCAGSALAVEPGEEAPDFKLPQRNGVEVKLSERRGKYIYLDFWASWCVSCKLSFPWMEEISKKYSSEPFEIIAINLDKKEAEAEKFLNSNPASFTVLYDPTAKVAAQYRPKGMPSSYLISPEGKIISVHSGFKDSTRAEIEAEFNNTFQIKR